MSEQTGTRLPWRQMIPTEKIDPNPDNPRSDFGDLDELEQSIRKNGLLQPIIVRPSVDEDDRFVIEAGERRYRAMRGWASEIPSVVRPVQYGEDPTRRNLIVGLVENIFRKELNPMERAEAFGRLRDEMGMNASQIAIQLGLSVSTVTNSMALLELAPETRKLVRRGTLKVTDAQKLIRRHRAQERSKKGKPQRGTVWDVPFFAGSNPLYRKARILCDAQDHQERRRYGGACGHCWAAVIRQDQDTVQQAAIESAIADREWWESRTDTIAAALAVAASSGDPRAAQFAATLTDLNARYALGQDAEKEKGQ